MTTVKAPFNFIPFNSEQVFYPEWAKGISQDIPFKDGVSGKLNLSIEACSPIFVRNGHLNTNEADIDPEFSNFKGKNFIPGTSVKGMLRSVLEVLSFSKLSIYNNNRYAVRDLSNKALYMNRMVPKEKDGEKFIRCGWLTREIEEDEIIYKIKDCGKPDRITFSNIDAIFETKMNPFFQKGGGYQANDKKHKSAQFKYDKFKEVEAVKTIHCLKKVDKQFVKLEEEGERGVIVFTGQPSHRVPPVKSENKKDRKKGKGKGSEFIFWEDKKLTVFKVPQEVIKDFKFAYYDHDENRQSMDWKYWTKKIKNKERIPVFFQLNEKEDNVAHLGLSYLYKLPYEHRVGDYLKEQKLAEMDLAECIFGRVEGVEKVGASLKGRVHIGHAFATNTVEKMELKEEVLSSPKASFYPFYVHQEIQNDKVKKGKYRTFMDSGSDILAGRKRYPIHGNGVKSNPPPIIKGKANEKVTTKFLPLDKGAKFQCTLTYHNLRKAELGALISAITFHNTNDCFHSIGMAKPLGYGKIKVHIEGLNKEEQVTYMQAFETLMNTHCKKWTEQEALSELVTMASEPIEGENSKPDLTYMPLDDFQKVKKNKEALNRYTKLEGVQIKKIQPLLISQKNISIYTLLEGLEQLETKCDQILSLKKKELERQKASEELNHSLKLQQEARKKAFQEEGLAEKVPLLDDITKLGKKIEAYLRTLKIECFDATEHAALKNILIKSYELVAPKSERKRKAWQEKLFGKLKKWLNDEALATEWLPIILKNK